MSTENFLKACVEAALLTTGGPVAEAGILDAAELSKTSPEDISAIFESLRKEWEEEGRGVFLERVAGGWRMATRPELDDFLRRFHGLHSRQKLSQAALEVLSIVAYRQPVTLPEINFIRASNSSSVMKTLLERGLVRIAGRKKVVGKPFLYRTTRDFLIHFGLDSLEELPNPEDLVKEPKTSSGQEKLPGTFGDPETLEPFVAETRGSDFENFSEEGPGGKAQETTTSEGADEPKDN